MGSSSSSRVLWVGLVAFLVCCVWGSRVNAARVQPEESSPNNNALAARLDALLADPGARSLGDVRELLTEGDWSDEQISRALRHAADMSDAYAEAALGILGQLDADERIPEFRRDLIAIARTTNHDELALGVCLQLSYVHPVGWPQVLMRWVDPQRMCPEHYAVWALQEISGHDWGLELASSHGMDAIGTARLRAQEWFNYLQAEHALAPAGDGARPARNWPFDESEARKLQEETGESLGVAVLQDVQIADGITMRMALVPAGEFEMGSPLGEQGRSVDEVHHTVRVSEALYVGVFEVTQEQWMAVMEANPSHHESLANPVENVSQQQCMEFIDRLNARVRGAPFRLPTEAEWEHACRAGTATRFHFGDDLDGEDIGDYAWYSGNSGETPRAVGLRKANAWGLHDMHGNVQERTASVYERRYGGAEFEAADAESSAPRSRRGGAYDYKPQWCRSASRSFADPTESSWNTGLRLVREVGK